MTKFDDLPDDVKRLLYEVEAMHRLLNRSGIRLDADFPDAEFQKAKLALAEFMFQPWNGDPTCIIKDCDNPGTHQAVIDLGPTVGGDLIPGSERKQTVWFCDEHHAKVSIGPG